MTIYNGKIWTCNERNSIAYLKVDNTEGNANVFNTQSLSELKEAIDALEKASSIKGLILHSGKEHFIFGADITEFLGHFKKSDDELKSWLLETNTLFNRIEDLPYPSVTAINGFALGGGLEVCLTTDYRVAHSKAKIGLPETKLGLIPGWGGTVRLSRITGADNAIEWIASGKQYKSQAGFQIGVIDGVTDGDVLKGAETLLERVIKGDLDYKEKRKVKTSNLQLNKTEASLVFVGTKGFVQAQAGEHYPAPVYAINAIEEGGYLSREEAISKETNYFVKCSRTIAASSLIRVFLGDQFLKKKSKKIAKGSEPIKKSAVIGAGIMGGGISYQSASKNIQVIMKDINNEALDLGLNEASKLLTGQLKRKRIKPEQMNKTMSLITPSLGFGEFENMDFVTEAVVENLDVKKNVLAELEDKVSSETIIASNTSTLSINEMAKALKYPEKFCGLHFFNPVHKMPLVEVVRGNQTSDETISRAVMFASQLGKTPIVVNDCSGFLVNRILFPYFLGFTKLVEDGVSFVKIDKVMEKFGWPMGPAYLLDVVGLDTAEHCTHVIGGAYSDRMSFSENNIIAKMFNEKRFGQKNSLGFYKYELNKKGKLKKSLDEKTNEIISSVTSKSLELSNEEVIERMMIPMIFESIRCLEDKIVSSATEVDMGLLYGLGFPPFRAGALKYADDLGLENLLESSKKYESLGKLYEAPQLLIDMAKSNQNFYQGDK